jgi:hypothetical protein
MAKRDLLHKPIPIVAPEEQGSDAQAPAAPRLNKLGVQERARELGGEARAKPATGRPGAAGKPAARPEPAATPAQARQPAFRAAYFNKDIESTNAINQRASAMQALRGGEGATDLKRIVLPPPINVQAPDPALLQETLERMAPQGESTELSLPDLLGRHGAWTKGEKVTAEAIAARLAQLERMVQDRLAALARLAKNSPYHLMRSPTMAQAATSGGKAHEQTDDLAAAGSELVQSTAAQAAGMHARLAKVMGTKGR